MCSVTVLSVTVLEVAWNVQCNSAECNSDGRVAVWDWWVGVGGNSVMGRCWEN